MLFSAWRHDSTFQGECFMHSRFIYAFVCLFLFGCTAAPTPTPPPSATQSSGDPHALIQHQGDFFVAAGNCGFCHTGLQDERGADVSIDSHWRSTMMANAARDPYYRASVRSEVNAFPQHRSAIENKCATCHTAMAFTTAGARGESPLLLDSGFFSQQNDMHLLAEDGVSCTVCHQIQDHEMGEFASFSGEYQIDTQTPHGDRLSFGPAGTTAALAAIMQNVSGYIPEESLHLSSSEVCAVCHTLFTNTFTAAGDITDHLFPEQTPYLEWLHSSHAGETTCQGCHMPVAEGSVRIANTGGDPRSPFNQHQFVGGNVFMMQLFKNNSEALNVTADRQHFDVTEQFTRQQLEEQTLQLNIDAENQGDELLIAVNITNLTGHKFPSGFPSRRAWLHVTVYDAHQQAVFESGGWNRQGAITTNRNDSNGQQYEPHYDLIDSQDQVQIYESIMGCMEGEITTSLMLAHHYIKDNRLLPAGFDKDTASAYIQVAGEARSDPNFVGGSDTVYYRVNTSQAPGPLIITAQMLYQPAGYRWLHKFSGDDSAEAITFLSFLQNTPPEPVIVVSQELKYTP
jgi:hypothetical protein